ncbi:MAG: signal peptidase I [Candidatus Lokiarchaeota archaeon]|nr:signal peptidase I [Candidatus Lokiarchaeota archaeon]
MKNDTEKEKKPIPRKKIIIAVVMISIAFFGSFLVYFILQISFNTESPIVVVLSGSMEPQIHKGDLLFVMGTEPENIKSGTIEDKDGDIIVFNAQGLWPMAPIEPIVHRVIEKEQIGDTWYFRTKGDANSIPDPDDVPESRVIGVVIGGIPYIGWVKIFLTESGLLIPLLVVISAILIISIVRDIYKDDDDDQDEKNKEEQENTKVEQEKTKGER